MIIYSVIADGKRVALADDICGAMQRARLEHMRSKFGIVLVECHGRLLAVIGPSAAEAYKVVAKHRRTRL